MAQVWCFPADTPPKRVKACNPSIGTSGYSPFACKTQNEWNEISLGGAGVGVGEIPIVRGIWSDMSALGFQGRSTRAGGQLLSGCRTGQGTLAPDVCRNPARNQRIRPARPPIRSGSENTCAHISVSVIPIEALHPPALRCAYG
eukprot:2511486-Rhodomonas_salina.3